MTSKQTKALKNVQSILQRNFQQSLLSVVFVDEKDGMKKKIQTMDGTANDAQAEHLARTTLQNIEIQTLGFIKTVFDVSVPISNRNVKESKAYPSEL